MQIREYQLDGIELLTTHRRALLADEPGLGKTMQALLSMRYLVPEGRILVVCTGDAIGVWRDQIPEWLDEEPVGYFGLKPDESALDYPGFVITNYSRMGFALESRQWDGVIFDESQMLRNRNTASLFKTVRAALGKQRFDRVPIFFLSGTPIVKAAGDLWPILYMIDRKRFGSYWRFVQKYAVVWQDRWGWHVEGVTNIRALWADLDSVALRRTVEEVQPSLPPKVRQRIPLEMSPRQAKAYRELEGDMIAEIDGGALLLAPSVLARETRLRQLLVSPRLIGIDDAGAAIPALVAMTEGHARPIVVYTPFRPALPIIEAAMAKSGRPAYLVHGGMGFRFGETLKEFKQAAKAGDAPVLVATVQMGRSWSAADVSFEPYFIGFDWNETTMLQAEKRLHRNEQTRTVFARYFVHNNTHDSDILEVLAGKKRLADVIMDRVKVRRFRSRSSHPNRQLP